MPNLNKVFLIGTLTRDPEIRHTQSGFAVAEISLAINRVVKTNEGEKREEVVFVNVTLWGRLAEVTSEYMRKGRPIFVEGRLKLDTWDDKQTGQKRSKLGVVGEAVQFLGPKDMVRGDDDRPPEEAQRRSSSSRAPSHDPDIDGEPDDLPFLTTVYKDVRKNRLNRMVF